jgi:hypothetical protein
MIVGAAGAVLLVGGVVVGVVLATRGGGETTTAVQDTPTNTVTTTTTSTLQGSAAFSKPSSLFQPVNRGDASATFSGNTYVFQLESANRPLVSVADRDAPLNVRVRVDIQSVGNRDYGAAVLCRYQSPRDYYLLAIASGQRYNIVKYADGKPRSLVGGFQTSSAIRPGASRNRVEAQCYGTGTVVLNLIVNGLRVSSAADADGPLTSGTIGLRAGTTEPTVRVRFEHFVMSELKNP